MENGLEKVLEQIKRDGLPSTERIRADLEEREKQELQASLQLKFSA